MKTIFAALILAGVALPAAAAGSCDTFTSELWDEGVRTAVYTPGKLVITDHGKSEEYHIMSVGTGIPYRAAISEKNKSKGLPIREYKGALIIDMEVFEPTCK